MARHTLSELAQIAGATLQGDGEYEVEGTAALADALPHQISFCAHPRFRGALERTAAGAVIVPPGLDVGRSGLHLLVHSDPSAAFSAISGCFAPEREAPVPGVSPASQVHPSAEVGPEVSIGPFCTVGALARLGKGVVLHPGVRIGPGVTIGESSEIHANAVLHQGVTVGARCLVHAGAVLGSDGFGFEPPREPGGTWSKIPHTGVVVIEDEVEIGANCTIDRGRFGATRLGRGCKLDNLVQVAHNVVIGPGTMIAAQAGLSGSARVGRGVIIGGQVGVGGHLEIGDGARLGGQSGVIGHVAPGEELWGTPARPRRQVLRQVAQLGRMERLQERVAELERRLSEHEGSPLGQEKGVGR